jgi:S-adenosylmethionine hydrolase
MKKEDLEILKVAQAFINHYKGNDFKYKGEVFYSGISISENLKILIERLEKKQAKKAKYKTDLLVKNINYFDKQENLEKQVEKQEINLLALNAKDQILENCILKITELESRLNKIHPKNEN